MTIDLHTPLPAVIATARHLNVELEVLLHAVARTVHESGRVHVESGRVLEEDPER